MSQYDDVRCPTCGTPYEDHTAECIRHEFRPGPKVEAPSTVLAGSYGGSAFHADAPDVHRNGKVEAPSILTEIDNETA